MIYITGDTHGEIDFDKIKKYFKKVYCSEKEYLIILGDAGIVWEKENKDILFKYYLIGITIIFIDGNHENFDLLKTYPIVTFHNAKAHKVYDNIYHILRGEILELNGLSFLCVGGARSIDKYYRKEHISYWKDEDITIDDYNNAINNLAKYNNKVDYVLTHCAPTSILQKMFPNFEPDTNTALLEKIKEQIFYSNWFFGHYHIDKIIGNSRCFYNDIKEIPIMDIGQKVIKYNLLTLEYEGEEFLRNRKTGRKTKLKPSDLPEWYYESFSYRSWFYNLKGIKDVAIIRSPFSNHINKDTRLYFSYDKILPKTKDYEPINKEDWEVDTWRVSLVDIIKAIEKYNPTLKLDKIKEQINLVYDYFNDDLLSHGVIRPYLDIKTKRLKTKYRKIAICYVEYEKQILSQFFSIENAERFILNVFYKDKENVSYTIINDIETNEIKYKFSNLTESVIIKRYKD